MPLGRPCGPAPVCALAPKAEQTMSPSQEVKSLKLRSVIGL